MRYFDAHCHLQFDAYDLDRDALIARMAEKEVGGIVVGVDRDSSIKAVALAKKHPHLFASAGIHPNDTPDERFDEAAFRELAADGKTVAIGECGLDFFRHADADDAEKARQKGLFERHIALAAETGKPLIIHARPSKGTMDAYEDALDLLRSAKREYGDRLTGDFHFFVGDTGTARKIFELDFTVSYTAVLTFTHDYDEVVRAAPLDRLLAETDAPYVAPVSRRGQRNDPLAVMDVVEAMARIRGEELDAVRRAVLDNAKRLFDLSGSPVAVP
ncbi:TatD family hydrolase [Patescibacteria group bacterium]|nr:TatD family hydrolase [Patescibacteria group bacterium]